MFLIKFKEKINFFVVAKNSDFSYEWFRIRIKNTKFMDNLCNDCMHLTTLVKDFVKMNGIRYYIVQDTVNIFVYAPIRIPVLKGA